MIDEELKDIARHYGRDHQTLKAAEEFGEAATAGLRLSPKWSLALARQAEASGGKYRCITALENNLAEECADCLVMIGQLRLLIPGFSAKVDLAMHEKIERQINRISKEQQC